MYQQSKFQRTRILGIQVEYTTSRHSISSSRRKYHVCSDDRPLHYTQPARSRPCTAAITCSSSPTRSSHSRYQISLSPGSKNTVTTTGYHDLAFLPYLFKHRHQEVPHCSSLRSRIRLVPRVQHWTSSRSSRKSSHPSTPQRASLRVQITKPTSTRRKLSQRPPQHRPLLPRLRSKQVRLHSDTVEPRVTGIHCHRRRPSQRHGLHLLPQRPHAVPRSARSGRYHRRWSRRPACSRPPFRAGLAR